MLPGSGGSTELLACHTKWGGVLPWLAWLPSKVVQRERTTGETERNTVAALAPLRHKVKCTGDHKAPDVGHSRIPASPTM